MGTAHLRAAAAVLAAAVAAFVLYETVLGISRSGVDPWAVVEGVLIGVAVLAVWHLVRTRAAAATGVALAAAIVVIGVAGVLDAASPFAQAPLGWAVALTLLVRLVAPAVEAGSRARR